MTTIYVTSPTTLTYEGKEYACAIGKAGFVSPEEKREGDLKTPTGTYPLRECWYRKDRVAAPKTHLIKRIITEENGWCDAPDHPNYNHHVALPFDASHETLWRSDNRYDIIIPLGYNDDPVVAGKGSAIFFHLASDDYQGTEGCIAVSLEDMVTLLSATHMRIDPA